MDSLTFIHYQSSQQSINNKAESKSYCFPLLYMGLKKDRPKLLGSNRHALFFDTRALTTTATLEVKLGATHLTYFVHRDRLDIGRVDGEQTLNTYTIGDFTNGEGSRHARTLALDHIALKTLNTLFVTFYNLIVYGDIVTSFELGELTLYGKLLVYICYCVHNSDFAGRQR